MTEVPATISFLATLQGAGCLRTDDDGSIVIKLTADGSQIPKTVRLNAMLKQLLRVTIAIEPN